MLKIAKTRFASLSFNKFITGIGRYRFLNSEDKQKLLSQHSLKTVSSEDTSIIYKILNLPSNTANKSPKETTTKANHNRIHPLISRHLERAENTTRKQFQRRQSTPKVNNVPGGVDPTAPPFPYEIKSDLFSQKTETSSLVSDVIKATKYEDLKHVLEEIRPVPQHVLTDKFIDVMSRAIEENISNLERPALVNELSDYESAYAMKRAAIRNLLVNKCTRNEFEETRVEKFIDSHLNFYKQRLNSPLPPEVLEPLAAFRGDVYYSFSPMTRLQQKINAIHMLVQGIVNGDKDIVTRLPEFAGNGNNYPFRNYYGFKSCIPDEVTGSINMGKIKRDEHLRYPNLQCVAHSLPRDPKYRAVVTHAIKILERSRGWDQLSKIKAINRLVQVYNNLASSAHYSEMLNKAIPLERKKGTVIKTLTRQEVFNKGLKYIPSLFRNHWNRSKRK
ncbi:conserved hypothetical protein [Theileria equi strain WA]|uniref:Uncharacterized protein n=1 Tax=Theileria equi strain WA TaxID=1537102 RepID=L1LGW8_THEEQ|nr:conserved hypothetical protein [Theileria equi strain WA]EKX74368.1 conserved hypothetical protein [Theileria equi strain WA]|eukprot:XP_004833820.1 conserved hypothetical protein [Theileria equi strain WA]